MERIKLQTVINQIRRSDRHRKNGERALETHFYLGLHFCSHHKCEEGYQPRETCYVYRNCCFDRVNYLWWNREKNGSQVTWASWVTWANGRRNKSRTYDEYLSNSFILCHSFLSQANIFNCQWTIESAHCKHSPNDSPENSVEFPALYMAPAIVSIIFYLLNISLTLYSPFWIWRVWFYYGQISWLAYCQEKQTKWRK